MVRSVLVGLTYSIEFENKVNDTYSDATKMHFFTQTSNLQEKEVWAFYNSILNFLKSQNQFIVDHWNFYLKKLGKTPLDLDFPKQNFEFTKKSKASIQNL